MAGIAYGTQRSLRRGQGTEIAGSRAYRPGDRLSSIDWPASARSSRARDTDSFVVREYYAELAPRVIIVVDRQPSMALYGAGLPYLSKPDVLREASVAIIASANAARAYVGYLDVSRGAAGDATGETRWVSPHRQSVGQILPRFDDQFEAPPGSLELALDYLLTLRRDVPMGSFVFVLSDFLRPLPAHIWSRIRGHGWDCVPVIIQDPTWEQSFPDVSGLLVPFSSPTTGRAVALRLTQSEVEERRARNEDRLRRLLADFQRLQFDPVVLDQADAVAIDLAFISWATGRKLARGRAS